MQLTMKAMRYALSLLATLSLATVGLSKPEFLEQLEKLPQMEPAKRAKAEGCNLCHTNPPRRNEFGRAVHDAMEAAGKEEVNAALLVALADGDADGDGVSNGEEFRQDSLPNDRASKPGQPDAMAPPVRRSGIVGARAVDTDPNAPVEAPEEEEGEEQGEMIPDHRFHPALVHFPIALFLFGALLDWQGAKRKNSVWREAGWLALAAGTIMTVPAMATGWAAYLANGYAFEGEPMRHLIAGHVAFLLMVGTTLMRRQRTPESIPYWSLLAMAAVAVGVAGHLGSTLVFG
jgi:uncharacterized membrane protein